MKSVRVKIDLNLAFKYIAFFFTIVVLCIIALLVGELILHSAEVILRYGFSFFFGWNWDPKANIYGALPMIYGTLFTATLALLIAIPISIGIATFLTEIAPPKLREFLTTTIELIAAIPSVVIGLWAIFYLAPLIRDIIHPLFKPLSFIPFFSGETFGYCYLTATLVLVFMITPIMTSIFKEAFESVPKDLKDAMYALGATRYETIRHITIPFSRTAIFTGTILAYGRALGETLAVTMVIGNQPNITLSLFSPGYTLAAVIANEFIEATSRLHVAALIGMGLILFIISLIVNFVGVILLKRLKRW